MLKHFLVLIFCGAAFASCAQSPNDQKAVKETITAFAKAGDQNDVETLTGFLDPNYRIVMNQLFGTAETMVIDRKTYLDKIGSKEWGVTIEKLPFSPLISMEKTPQPMWK
ncbi:MAG: hypothetical protein ACJA08_002573 [Cyclobacteriaceae bacterium]|jgi:hypothetical protein